MKLVHSKTARLIESLLDQLNGLLNEWSRERKEDGKQVDLAPIISDKILLTPSNDIMPSYDCQTLESTILLAFRETVALIAPIDLIIKQSSHCTNQLEEWQPLSCLFESQRLAVIELCHQYSNAVEQLLKPLQDFKPFRQFLTIHSNQPSSIVRSQLLAGRRFLNPLAPFCHFLFIDDSLPSLQSLVRFDRGDSTNTRHGLSSPWNASFLAEIQPDEIEEFITAEFTIPLSTFIQWPEILVIVGARLSLIIRALIQLFIINFILVSVQLF